MNKGYLTTEGFYDNPVLVGAYRADTNKEKDMIKGLSEIRRPPRLGKLRLGIKVPKTRKDGSVVEYPKEVDYFILDPETPEKGERESLLAQFHGLFGEEPKSIDIMLPTSNIEEVFPQNYMRYGSSTSLKCIGDGETATCIEDEFAKGLTKVGVDDKGKTRVECKGRGCIYSVNNEAAKTKECSATATLNVMIPKLVGMGVWQVTTGSFHSIVNINSCIHWITLNYGRAHMLPLVLERRPQDTTHKGKKSTHFMLHINAKESVHKLIQTAQIEPNKVLLGMGMPLADTEAPLDTDDADVEVITEIVNKETGEIVEEAPDDSAGAAIEPVDNPAATDNFIEGLKEDNKKEYNTTERAAAPKTKPAVKDNFLTYMAKVKVALNSTGKYHEWTDIQGLYSFKILSDIPKEKHKDIRVYTEAKMEELGVKVQ